MKWKQHIDYANQAENILSKLESLQTSNWFQGFEI